MRLQIIGIKSVIVVIRSRLIKISDFSLVSEEFDVKFKRVDIKTIFIGNSFVKLQS